MNNFYGKDLLCPFLTEKNLRVMKLVTVMLTIVLLKVSAAETHAQRTTVNLNITNSSIKEVLKEIEKQSEYTFFYNDLSIDMNRKVDVNANEKRIDEILSVILPNCTFKVENKRIIVIPTEQASAAQNEKRISGTIVDATGEPIIGANVAQKGTTNGTIT